MARHEPLKGVAQLLLGSPLGFPDEAPERPVGGYALVEVGVVVGVCVRGEAPREPDVLSVRSGEAGDKVDSPLGVYLKHHGLVTLEVAIVVRLVVRTAREEGVDGGNESVTHLLQVGEVAVDS